MGREIRKVPPNWESPPCQNGKKGPQPMYDSFFGDAVKEWKNEYDQWATGSHEHYDPESEYWEYNSPPDRAYYRPWKDEEATWYQVWETISEGTPVTPAFETTEELCHYLATKGDYWDQLREIEPRGLHSMKGGPWGRARAEAFIKAGHVPSMMVVKADEGIEIYEAKDIALKHQEDRK